jgi:alkanesulfonate monooxygenase SsuD/methylene tetrahydromethanopterin reductase-like flavin-dependent oxidoreductase (luciferase family)
MPPLSILDLAFVPEGGTPADALRNTLDLAQHAERWGYRRFWLAITRPTMSPAALEWTKPKSTFLKALALSSSAITL